jgi:HEAT repeat protein
MGISSVSRTSLSLLVALALLLGPPVRAGGEPPAPGDPPAPSAPDPEEAEKQLAKHRQELEIRKAQLPASAQPALGVIEDFRRRELRLWAGPRARVVAMGRAATPALLVALEEIDWEVRAFAAACFEEIRDPEALVALRTALPKEKFVEARRRMVKALAALRLPDAEPSLAGAAADADVGIVLSAVRGIGALGRSESVPALRKHATATELDVRYEALGSLVALGDVEALDRLLAEADALVATKEARRYDDPNSQDYANRYQQYLVGLALSRSGEKRADSLLGDVLEAKKPWDKKTFLRLGAAEGLGRRVASGGALHPKLLKGLDHDEAQVRVACAYGLQFVGRPEVTGALVKALSDSQLDVRCNVVRALARVPSPDAAKALRKALRDRAGEVRVATVRALGTMDQEEATKALLEALADEKYVIRVIAARALGSRTAATGVVEALVKATGDPDYGVREQALASLSQAWGQPDAALPALWEGLKDPDPGVQASACLAVATLLSGVPADRALPPVDDAAVRRVLSILTDTDNDRLLRAAVEFFDSLRPPSAVQPLIAALAADKAEVRRRAHSVLQRMTETSRDYRFDAPAGERDAGRRRWEEWWAAGRTLPKRERRVGLVVTGPLAEQARDVKWRGLDIVLLLDSTGSMAGLLRAAKQGIDEIISEMGSPLPSLRIGLFTYRDFGDDYVFYGTPLTYDVERLPGFLQSFVHGQGGDIPEALYQSASAVMQHLNWRKDAHKVLIFAGDAPHHPETDAAFRQAVRNWATPQNRAVVHAIFTDTNRRSLDVAKRKERAAPDSFGHPYFDLYTKIAKEGRGKCVLLDDESTLIKEILVLAFGPAWRTEIETFLDFRR